MKFAVAKDKYKFDLGGKHFCVFLIDYFVAVQKNSLTGAWAKEVGKH